MTAHPADQEAARHDELAGGALMLAELPVELLGLYGRATGSDVESRVHEVDLQMESALSPGPTSRL